jgi:hypothetical protein
METVLSVKATDALIDRINLSPHEKAAAKAELRKAEAMVDALWRVGTVLSRWARLAVVKPIRRGIEWITRVPNSRFLGWE